MKTAFCLIELLSTRRLNRLVTESSHIPQNFLYWHLWTLKGPQQFIQWKEWAGKCWGSECYTAEDSVDSEKYIERKRMSVGKAWLTLSSLQLIPQHSDLHASFQPTLPLQAHSFNECAISACFKISHSKDYNMNHQGRFKCVGWAAMYSAGEKKNQTATELHWR